MCRPSSSASARAWARAASKSAPFSISRAPSARIASFFSGLLPCGTQMVTASPCAAPARARLWPWLPRVALTTPLSCGRVARSSAM